jgi:ABC-type nitrate/sulfonate/bicarbonate transport system substrate-binding protein
MTESFGARPIRIGALRLTDSAPVIVAYEFGYFADEGLDVQISIEPSWANVADKLAYGALDAAVLLPPLAFSVSLGLRGAAEPLIVPYSVNLGGSAITLEAGLARETIADANGGDVARALTARLKRADSPLTLSVVHEYSPHALLLRYWLAAAGAVAGRDYLTCVTPPARTVDALKAKRIVGFCAGAPWGEIAARARVGATVATSHDVWRNGPEKAFAVRERWAQERPDALSGLLRALWRAGRFCDAPENSSYVAALLSRRTYLALDSHAILSSLPGTSGARIYSRFFSGAATFPWRSHALWFLVQMVRWELLEPGLPLRAIAERVYRPDLYATALGPAGAPLPASSYKIEGGHAADWSLPASPAPVVMKRDLFCDGSVFDPDQFAPTIVDDAPAR